MLQRSCIPTTDTVSLWEAHGHPACSVLSNGNVLVLVPCHLVLSSQISSGLRLWLGSCLVKCQHLFWQLVRQKNCNYDLKPPHAGGAAWTGSARTGESKSQILRKSASILSLNSSERNKVSLKVTDLISPVHFNPSALNLASPDELLHLWVPREEKWEYKRARRWHIY